MYGKINVKPSVMNMSNVSKYFNLMVTFYLFPLKIDKEKKIVSFKFGSRPVIVFCIMTALLGSLQSIFTYIYMDSEKLSLYYYKMFFNQNVIDALSTFAMMLSHFTAVMCFWIFIYRSGNLKLFIEYIIMIYSKHFFSWDTSRNSLEARFEMAKIWQKTFDYIHTVYSSIWNLM